VSNSCRNPDCPIGCPDSHAVVYAPEGFKCGTFRPCPKCGRDWSGHKLEGTGRFTSDGRHEVKRPVCP
jgi:hypothetical protein